MRQIVLAAVVAVAVMSGACKGGSGSAAAVAKIQELYGKRAQVSDGWLTVMEQNAADPVAGLQKGAEYVSANAPILAQMAGELCGVIRANQKDTAVRSAFQQVNEDVKAGMEAWKVRAGAVNEKYPEQAQVLSAQYIGLNSAFFDTAKSCMPE